jgi:type IV secretion system protein VirB1
VEVILAPALLACAANVAPATLTRVAYVESRGYPWSLHDNATGRSYRARSQAQAAAWARSLIARGHSVDLGEMQVNDSWLCRFHISVERALDPCENIRMGGAILTHDYV